MRAYNSGLLFPLLAVSLLGCDAMHPRPSNVPSTAVWVDHAFIDCSTGTPSHANRCTVYKDDTGEILADGLFILNLSHFAAAKCDLRYIAFGKRRIYLENATWLVEEAPTDRDPSYRIVDEELKKLASSGGPETPINCNRSDSLSTVNAMGECAMKAFIESHPFFVRYYQPMSHSFSYRAFAANDSRHIYFVEWYSDEFPFGERAGSGFDGAHGLVNSCPIPVRLVKTTNGELTCANPVATYERLFPPILHGVVQRPLRN
jgi:hypothetical protein